MGEMEPNDYQLVRIALLAGISARAAELGDEILTEAEDTIDDLRRENAALREALVALRHARDLEIETSQSWPTDRAWREGWAKVDAALATVPADPRGERERSVIEAAQRYREACSNYARTGQHQMRAQTALFDAVDALDAPPAGREGGEDA